MPVFERAVSIATTPERLFDFHTDTNNLSLISPPSFKAKLISDEGTGMGRTLALRVTRFGIPSLWEVTISEFDRPNRLSDLVTKGPFKYFHHRRIFTPNGGMTNMTDTVEYELPMGVLGKIADRLFVRKMISDMFAYRQERTKELLEDAA